MSSWPSRIGRRSSSRRPSERVRRSTERAEHIIDALLTMAVSNQGVDVVEPVDLATAAEDALDAIGDQVLRSGLRLETRAWRGARSTAAGCCSSGWSANLVENAVTHNVPQGWVRVRSWSDNGLGRPRSGQQRASVERGGTPGSLRALSSRRRREQARPGSASGSPSCGRSASRTGRRSWPVPDATAGWS